MKQLPDFEVGWLLLVVVNHQICRGQESVGNTPLGEGEQDFKSQNRFVIRAVNDYHERHLRECDAPFLSTREKEDSFVEGIISAVYDRAFR